MSKKAFEQQLAALDELRNSTAPSAVEGLRKALTNRNNYLVAKAAQIGAQSGLVDLISELLSAFDRFLVDPSKSDPQCWAKNAVIQALADLGHNNSAVYVRGLRHVQMEPVWGGQEDTAGPLRARCALALVQCQDLSDLAVLSHLVEPLVDRDKTVRMEAARAIGRLGRAEAALLLRLRALVGDKESEVLGACFAAVLEIEGEAGIDFVGRFLAGEDDVVAEAALALGGMHDARALRMLQDRQERERDPYLIEVLLTAIGLTRLPDAVESLVKLVEADSPKAVAAVQALASARISEETRGRLAKAVESSGNARLCAAFEKHFG